MKKRSNFIFIFKFKSLFYQRKKTICWWRAFYYFRESCTFLILLLIIRRIVLKLHVINGLYRVMLQSYLLRLHCLSFLSWLNLGSYIIRALIPSIKLFLLIYSRIMIEGCWVKCLNLYNFIDIMSQWLWG